MKLLKGTSLAITMVICLSCKTVTTGTNFVRPADDSLILGKTTIQEIRQKLGNPHKEKPSTVNNENLINFLYSYTGGTPNLYGKILGRTIVFSFYNDVLISYLFMSSFNEDNTDFNETKLNQIKKGQTKEEEVIDILGKPSGISIYPIAGKDRKLLKYVYNEYKGLMLFRKLYSKDVIISLDQNGIVTNFNFSSDWNNK
ncbi:MAG: hypothetical protein V1874_04155 [Spirochaetota bacterium]